MEVLNKKDYIEYQEFLNTYPKVAFQQNLCWANIKKGWEEKVIISRDDNNKIVGAVLVLIKKVGPVSFMYAPRGPVCDYSNEKVMIDLLEGVRKLAKKYSAFKFICDPMILENDSDLIKKMQSYGFYLLENPDFGATIQSRHNYIIDNIENLCEEELLNRFSRNTRYKIRLAKKRGVEVREGKELLDDFYNIYTDTSQRKHFVIRSKEYIKSILDEFNDNAKLIVCYYNNMPLCGAVVIHSASTTSYLYGASVDNYRNLMPTYLLQYEIIKWASENKSSVYDMQGICLDEGINKELYNVYKFKCNFSGEVIITAGEFEIIYNRLFNYAFNKLRDIKRIIDFRKKYAN